MLDSPQAGGVLLRGGVLRFTGFAASIALSVASTILLTRHLGVSRFGQYTTVMSLVAVVAAVTDAGMSNYGTREFSIQRGTPRDVFMQALLELRIVLSLVGVPLIVGFAAIDGYDGTLMLGAAAAGLATLPLVFQHTLSIPLSTELRLGVVAGLELARQALVVAGLAALVVVGAGILPLLMVTLLANVLLVAPTARLVRGRFKLGLALSPSRWPALLQATIVFSLASAVGTIYVFTAQILTSLVASPHENGLFAVSFRVFVVSAGVPGLLVGAALPLLSRAARDDAARLAHALNRILTTALVFGIGSAVTLSAGSGFIVSVLAGPRFADAGGVLAIQAWALAAAFVVASCSYGLLSLHQHRSILFVNLVALLISVSLTLLLAPGDGARGAAIATVAGETTMAITSLIALARSRPALRPDLRTVLKVAAAVVLATVAGYVPDLPSLVRAVLAGTIYAAAVLVLRAVPSELLELVRPG
jgi:O-antigen/teichoic acid export membrane protein